MPRRKDEDPDTRTDDKHSINSEEEEAKTDRTKKTKKAKSRSNSKKKQKKRAEDSDDDSTSTKRKRNFENDDGERWIPVSIHDEDIAEGDELGHEQVYEYLEIDFQDGTSYLPLQHISYTKDTDHLSLEEQESTDLQEIYVEGLATGTFRRSRKHPNATNLVDKRRRQDSLQGPDGLIPLMTKLAEIQDTFLLMCQGILAGYAVLHMYSIFSVADTEFVCSYAGVANEARRFMFVFCNLSVIASVAKYLQIKHDRAEWKSIPLKHQRLMLFTIIVYVAAYICNNLAASTGTQMFFEHARDKQWCMTAHKSEEYATKIQVWKALSIARFGCILLGWMLVCLELHRDRHRRREARSSSESLEEQLKLRDMRIEHLQGQRLDALTVEELRALLKTHQTAVETTQQLLSLRT